VGQAGQSIDLFLTKGMKFMRGRHGIAPFAKKRLEGI
jgi:hypothetical protein